MSKTFEWDDSSTEVLIDNFFYLLFFHTFAYSWFIHFQVLLSIPLWDVFASWFHHWLINRSIQKSLLDQSGEDRLCSGINMSQRLKTTIGFSFMSHVHHVLSRDICTLRSMRHPGRQKHHLDTCFHAWRGGKKGHENTSHEPCTGSERHKKVKHVTSCSF